MELSRLAIDSPLSDYERQAAELLGAWQAGDPAVVQVVRAHHPWFLDSTITWLPRRLTDEEVRAAPFGEDDARLALARFYVFRDWASLAVWVEAVQQPGSAVSRFEHAVEAVIAGSRDALASMLQAHPDLVRARSTRVTPHDPPVHGATLLHYLGANGIEGYREKVPANAVDVARLLLESGAEVDALAWMYGDEYPTLPMLVSSGIAADAGVQVPLVHALIDFGASVEGRGTGRWASPLMTALAFGQRAAAEALVARGARVGTLAAAAGLGRLADAERMLPGAGSEDRHRALALASQLGHVEIVRLLLDAGEDPNRYNPEGNHAHSTPLHQAVWSDHEAVVRLLVERGARLDIEDTVWKGTPLGWAEYGHRDAIAAYLRERMRDPRG
jgi:ankyrin repeat protein